MKTILVTGSAGFIGSNLVLRLFKEQSEGTIVGLDNLNDYYDPTLKDYRLSEIEKAKPAGIEYEFVKGDLADKALIDGLFEKYHFDVVVNLAAQAGVRYSITNPDAYIQSNMIGFYNILEACRHYPVEHLVYASSSSVYGGNKKVPFSTDDRVDNPVSLYACHLARMTVWIIPCRSTQPPRRVMSCLHTAIRSFTTSRQQACASLLFMALLDVLIWHTLALLTNC